MLKARNKGVVILTVLLILCTVGAKGQLESSRVSFASPDGVEINADLYLADSTFPYMILYHDLRSSRGEFDPILKRFQKMNFNCLVPDLRNGGNSSFLANETLKRVREQGASTSTAISSDRSR